MTTEKNRTVDKTNDDTQHGTKVRQQGAICENWDWTRHYDALIGNLDDEMSLRAVETAIAARRIALHEAVNNKYETAYALTKRLESLDGMGMTIGEMSFALLELVGKFGLEAVLALTNEELEELLYEEVSHSWDSVENRVSDAIVASLYAHHQEDEFSAIVKHICDACNAQYLVRYKAKRDVDGAIVPAERVVINRKCSCGTEDEPWDGKPSFEEWVYMLNDKYGRAK